MKNNSLKILGSILGLGTFLMITPTFVVAEESESTIPSIDINLLSQDTEHAGILDVKVSDLIGIDNINVKIPNVEENVEELANVSITDDEIGVIEANVLTKSETVVSNEQAVLDLVVENVPIIDKVDVEVLKEEENTTTASTSTESALVDVAVEDLLVTEGVDVEVLKEAENTSSDSDSTESALVDVAVEDLLVTESVDVEVLKEVENTSTASTSTESTLVDVAVEDLLVTEGVDVEMLKEEENTTTASTSAESALVDFIVEELLVTDQVELSVLDSENFLTNEKQKETQQGVRLKLNNLPLFETLHVGVLENQFEKNYHSQQEDSSLITLGLGEESSLSNSLIDKVELNVLENSQLSIGNMQAKQSSVVGLELNDTTLGDLSTFVLLTESTMDRENRTNNSGLLEVNTNDLILLEDIHLGVLDRHVDEDGETSSVSDGLLQLDLMSDFTDEISIDVLTNDEFTNNGGNYQNGNTISIGLTNDLVGEINVDILPTENFIAAIPTNPIPPMEDVEEGVEDNEEEGGTSEEIITEDTPVIADNLVTEDSPIINKDEDRINDPNAPSDEEIIVVEDEGVDSADTMVQNPALSEDNKESLSEETSAEEDGFNLSANYNNNNDDGNFFSGSSLPQTGGIFTGIMLLIIALSLLSSGWTIRKLA